MAQAGTAQGHGQVDQKLHGQGLSRKRKPMTPARTSCTSQGRWAGCSGEWQGSAMRASTSVPPPRRGAVERVLANPWNGLWGCICRVISLSSSG